MPSRSDDLRSKIAGAFAVEDGDDIGPSTGLFDSGGRTGQLRRIPVDQITRREDQPRRSMDPEALEELAASIRDRGVLQPIRVRVRTGGGYQIIAGERRWTAARRAGLREIPAVIAESSDDEAYLDALIENIQREDLNAIDRAQALKRLRVNLGAQSWEEVGRVIGITRRHVHHLLNLTELPEDIQADIRAGDLTEKHGRALALLQAYPEQRDILRKRIKAGALTGDAALVTAKQLRPAAAPVRAAPPPRPAGVEALARRLIVALGAAGPDELARAGALLVELCRVITETQPAAADAE